MPDRTGPLPNHPDGSGSGLSGDRAQIPFAALGGTGREDDFYKS